MGTSPRSKLVWSSPPEELRQRVREEYRQMPGLRLTALQAQRLFGLEPLACTEILKALVKENFLSCIDAGVFKRP
jgi:hypothetical protein